MARLPELWREPFALSTRLSRLMDELFADFEQGLFLDWTPFETFGRTDIYEKDGKLVYETELPGVKKEDIEIKVEDGRLIICGEVKRDERIERENYFRIGRRYGKFQRVFPLPEQIEDPKKIKATFEDGILRVTVPLRESLKKKEKTIEIKVE
ncbi:MAG: Hsp20/alpha crystallin family protein [Candidatus Bipolaricaulota bacterium]|nr:Hsp20/alpha crystallin family protein [Candidatus Bipolaricaulota bacterium]MDW8031306.1 Hsp20/alpha crystallin family protein [Candidatus Bipolaricaulota bacterium]